MNVDQTLMPTQSATFAVGIATRGRPAVLRESLTELGTQQRQPDLTIVTYTELCDIGDAPERFPHVRFLTSRPGLTAQRNTVLDQLERVDFVTFLDDDFWLAPDYLSVIAEVLLKQPLVTVATGKVLADGIHGPGLEYEQARRILQAAPRNRPQPATFHSVFNAYGCNMTLRLEPIRVHRLRFDEQLPLYGWYEDVDFSRQLATFGEVIEVHQAYGVHLGVKAGRQAGVRLGYSQVANPFYLARKGSVSWLYAVTSMLSRSLKNLVGSVKPGPIVDRRGRLRGNAHAWVDLLQGAIHPTRILSL